MAPHVTFPKPAPRYQMKAEARKRAERVRREVYWLVDGRDERRCRACRKRCRSTMEAVPDRLEHHHLHFRSLGGRHQTANLVSLCLVCHIETQQHRLIIRGNADETLTFEQDGRTWQG